MLNATTARILFIVAIACAAAIQWQYGLPVWVYFAIILAYLLIVFYGSYFIHARFFINSLWHGDRTKKTIAITFDDGPMAEFTPQLLDLLKKEQVPAAFFLIGKNIAKNEPLVKRMIDEGHTIGNHSFSHTYWFSLNKANFILSDLQQCDETIMRAVGKKPRLFRPPYGVTNPMVAKAVKAGGYQSIGWSIRTYDTNATDAGLLLRKSLKNLSNGDIILFHDWGKFTIGILTDFIKEARKRGFEIVGLEELLGIKSYY